MQRNPVPRYGAAVDSNTFSPSLRIERQIHLGLLTDPIPKHLCGPFLRWIVIMLRSFAQYNGLSDIRCSKVPSCPRRGLGLAEISAIDDGYGWLYGGGAEP